MVSSQQEEDDLAKAIQLSLQENKVSQPFLRSRYSYIATICDNTTTVTSLKENQIELKTWVTLKAREFQL